MGPPSDHSAPTSWPASTYPILSNDEGVALHGQPITAADVWNILQWGPMADPVKSGMATVDEQARNKLKTKYKRARLLAMFVAKRLAAGLPPHFTFHDYAVWNDNRSKPSKSGKPAFKVSELPAAGKAERQKSWGKNDPGRFSSCYRGFPCRWLAGGLPIGLAVVPVEGGVEAAKEYCCVYCHPDMKPTYAGAVAPTSASPSGIDSANPTNARQVIVEQKPVKQHVDATARVPNYYCVIPKGLGGPERDVAWQLNAISFLDGMTSAPHPDHLGEMQPDVHSPSVLQAARHKLEKEQEGFRFLAEDHTPVGYASLWRVAIESSNDLYGWIKGKGTMPYEKADLKMDAWQPPTPPNVWIGYVSSLRIHPRCRYNPTDTDGLRARMTLFYGVVKMLEDYALRGQLFVELVVWTTHIHERTFLRDLRGEHLPEAGENNNVVRLRLWPSPVKGKVFKRLAQLYAPYESLLSQAAENLRRNHGEPTLFDIRDGK